MPAYRRLPNGIALSVRLTPKGGRDAIDGIIALADGREAVAARVRAAPDKGAANTALIGLLAAATGRPKSAIRLISGSTARLKQVEVDGDAATLTAFVDGLPRK